MVTFSEFQKRAETVYNLYRTGQYSQTQISDMLGGIGQQQVSRAYNYWRRKLEKEEKARQLGVQTANIPEPKQMEIPGSIGEFTKTLGYTDKEFHREWYDYASVQHRFMLLAPRRHAKSTCLSVNYILWRIIKNPNIRILLVSNTDLQARGFVRVVKNLIEQHFPDLVPPGRDKWSETAINVVHTNIQRDPTLSAVGVNGPIISRREDLILCDDVIDPENAATEGLREKVYDWFLKVLMPTLEPNGQIIIVGTPFGPDDLYARLIADKFPYRRYDAIVDEDKKEVLWPEVLPFECELAQTEPEHKGHCCLAAIRRQMGSIRFNAQYRCLEGNAPILMADFNEKTIQDIKTGDTVVGFEQTYTSGHHFKLVPATVTQVQSRKAKVIKATLSDGREIICTPDHHWLSGKKHRTRDGFYKTLAVKTQRSHPFSLVSIYTPYRPKTSEEQREWDWLGGMMDGEGSANNIPYLSQTEEYNPEVCEAIRKTLTRLGIGYTQFPKFHLFTLHGGRPMIIKLIQNAKMVKRERFVKQLWNRSGRRLVRGGMKPRDKPTVVKIEPFGTKTVYSITTTSGNYIAYGLGSKNCDPSGYSGNKLKIEWIKDHYYRDLPTDLEIVMGVDPAISERTGADYTAITVLGYSEKEKKIYLITYYRGHYTFPEQLALISTVWKAHGAQRIIVEANAYQAVLAQGVQGMGLPVIPIKTVKDKVTRVLAISPYFENKTIRVKSDMDDFIHEYVQFDKGDHDDLLDSLTLAVQDIVDRHAQRLPEYHPTMEFATVFKSRIPEMSSSPLFVPRKPVRTGDVGEPGPGKKKVLDFATGQWVWQ